VYDLVAQDKKDMWVEALASSIAEKWGWDPKESEAVQLATNIVNNIHLLTFNTRTSSEALVENLLPENYLKKFCCTFGYCKEPRYKLADSTECQYHFTQEYYSRRAEMRRNPEPVKIPAHGKRILAP
jgi:hypothetical protein